jgi:hypothetical protein
LALSHSAISDRIQAFREGLRNLGYVEGKNIVIEYRYADGKFERLPDLATELAGLEVNVIVTGGPTATRPAKKATATIPIVMAQDTDPVGNGFVASLARPGGNITGLSNYHPDLSGKQLELLKEVVPRLARVAVLGNFQGTGQLASIKGNQTRWSRIKTETSIPGRARTPGHRNGIPCRNQGASRRPARAVKSHCHFSTHTDCTASDKKSRSDNVPG